MNCLPAAWIIIKSEMSVGIGSGEMELLTNARDSGDGYLARSDFTLRHIMTLHMFMLVES